MARERNAVVPPQNPTPVGALVQEFANSNLTPRLLGQQAASLLESEELLRNVRELAQEDQMRFVDEVDQAHPTVDSQNVKFLMALGSACSAIGQPPNSAIVSAGLETRGDRAEATGGFTDVWRGRVNVGQVAIKVFRVYPLQHLEEAKEILWKRVPVLRRLSHENILPFHGVNTTRFHLALVYDWGQNGNILQYIASHPHAPRTSLILDAAKGLEYLHSLDFPHGDFKGANVIIDEWGRARLTECGLAPINNHPGLTYAAVSEALVTSRWQAPEIINRSHNENGEPMVDSKAADVFAFGMFTVEVFTGKVPFEGLKKNEEVVLRIWRGSRPEKPQNAQAVGLTSEMWKFTESCWRQNPKRRPNMEEVVKRWQKFVESNGAIGAPPLAAGPTPSTSRPYTQPRTNHGTIRLETIPEIAPQRTRSNLVQRQFADPPPSMSIFPGRYQPQVLTLRMPQHLHADVFVHYSNLVLPGIQPALPHVAVFHASK